MIKNSTIVSVGIAKFSVLEMQPSNEALNRLLKTDVYQKEIFYHTDKGVKIVAVLKDLYSDFITFATFDISKEALKSNSGNSAFGNGLGYIRWAKSEDELPSAFFKGDVVQLNKGEDLLYGFLAKWSELPICLDKNKWFKGDFSELKQLKIANALGASVVVDTVNKKNLIYNKAFIKADEVERFRNQVYGEPYIKKLLYQDKINKDKNASNDDKRFFQDWEQLLVSMNSPNFPCPHFFYNGYLKTYIPEENIIEKNGTILK